MADRNLYLRYKQETRHLLYWMIHTSNSIINNSNAAPIAINTTGELKVSALLPMSKLIAEHVQTIPSTIYSLFQSVIGARTATYQVFAKVAATTPDPEIERSNLSHKCFIDALTEAFDALGGLRWASSQKIGSEVPYEDTVEEVVFANKFASLAIHGSEDGEEEDEEDGVNASPNALPVRPKKSAGKGKRGKRGKKTKGKPKPAPKEATIDDVPLESYRIIEDEEGLITDYLMAVYSVVKEWVDLRSYVQGLWREVSYGGLNSAVAGVMSNMAISMVKQTESAVFVNFPGHESYETVMKTITRGDPDKAQGMFSLGLHRLGPGNETIETAQEIDIDVKEQFLIHAYSDLLDFILDFQKTRSGKPTKPMMSEIRDWDPNFDLQRASKEGRIKWRRAYTINWLYDLVNVFSSIVVQRNKMKGEHHVFEKVDWSINGPWNEHRRLFGLNEFAGEITTLAMQKPGTDIRKRILPHHVFQIQCIVDSLAVSRGWSTSGLRGHILTPPARGFRPRRDVDYFLDRKNERMGRGYCQGVDILVQLFEKDAMLHGDPDRHHFMSGMLKDMSFDFINWLGESKYMHGLTTIPPSRFSNTNSNGLWEYSPFLCGVGLMEALELTYRLNLWIWDNMPEPMCLVHLHNMLMQKGYINQEIGLYATLPSLFPTTFFAGEKVPTDEFHKNLLAMIDNTGSRRARQERRGINVTAARTAPDIHGLLSLKANRFFKQESVLAIYREAEWVPERIPDEEVPIHSALCMSRIGKTKHTTDSAGKKVMENTTLVSRARSMGLSDETMIQMSSLLQSQGDAQQIPEAFLARIPKGYTLSTPSEQFGGRRQLETLKLDIISDICGPRPVLSLNYVWVTIRFMMLFHQFENRLKDLRNPLWVAAYEQNPVMMKNKRASLASLVLQEEDEECLEVMAKEFQNPRTGFMQHIYWEDLDLDKFVMDRDPLAGDVGSSSCTVM